MFGSQLKPNLLSIGDEYSRRDTEIVEDDNESMTSSQQEKTPKRRTNTTFSKRKPFQHKKPAEKNSTSHREVSHHSSKFNVENVDEKADEKKRQSMPVKVESDLDSFKSSLSMNEDIEDNEELYSAGRPSIVKQAILKAAGRLSNADVKAANNEQASSQKNSARIQQQNSI